MRIKGPAYILCQVPAGETISLKKSCETCWLIAVEQVYLCKCRDGSVWYCTKEKCESCQGTIIDEKSQDQELAAVSKSIKTAKRKRSKAKSKKSK